MIHPLQGTVNLISHQFNNATVGDYNNICNPEENKQRYKNSLSHTILVKADTSSACQFSRSMTLFFYLSYGGGGKRNIEESDFHQDKVVDRG